MIVLAGMPLSLSEFLRYITNLAMPDCRWPDQEGDRFMF